MRRNKTPGASRRSRSRRPRSPRSSARTATLDRRVLESLADFALFTTDRDGVIDSWTPGARRLFGWEAEEIIGRRSRQLFTPEDAERGRAEEELRVAEAHGRAQDERWHQRKDGSRFWASGLVTPLRDRRGRIVGFTKVARELSDRKQARDAAAEALERLQIVADGVPALLSYVDAEGRYRFMNRTYEDWFGRPRSEMLGKTVREVFGEPWWRGIAQYCERALAGEDTLFEREVETPAGRRWVRAHYRPDRGADGGVRGVLVMVTDVSETKRIEAELLAARRGLEERVARRTERLTRVNRELESFTYSASHDLRSPLRKIDAFSQSILEHCGERLDEDCRGRFRRVRDAVSQMNRLIDDMLSLARITQQEISIAPVELSALAEEHARALRAAEPGRPAEFAIAPELVVEGDFTLWRAALQNLLDNAWKFTRGREPARIELGAQREGGGLRYFVRDNGVGFDPRYAGKLFAPFQRLHRADEFPGTGVGLAIVRRALERQGWRVWAESAPDAGATFYFAPGERPEE